MGAALGPALRPVCCVRTGSSPMCVDPDDSNTETDQIDYGSYVKATLLIERTKDFSQEEAQVCCGGRRKWYWATGLGLWAVVTFLFLPRNPTWEVKELTFKDFTIPALRTTSLVAADTEDCPKDDPCGEALAKGCSQCPHPAMDNDGCLCRGMPVSFDNPRGFFGGLSDFISHLDDGAIITMTLQSIVDAYNPNFIGASTLPGTFNVYYKNDLLGQAGVRPLTIPGGTSIVGGAQGTTNLTVDVRVTGVSPVLGMEMLQEILETGYQMRLRVTGFVTAVAGPLHVKARAECDLRTNITAYMDFSSQALKKYSAGSFPATTFTERHCFYSYGL
eukprot:CAMPEP_0117497448 /NCGR_PEP_ID=MMETSP0784-20121206/21188_1 /TAXON_ID=39447 /ORGANISM="" /LENGTH=331 /DNA_ID=CAMNT_0005292471 /DNA_START=73 /DNA_END=1068 /DNA_ORIENTATION=+